MKSLLSISQRGIPSRVLRIHHALQQSHRSPRQLLSVSATRRELHQHLSPALEERLQEFKKRHDDILEIMSSSGHSSPALGKELSSYSATVQLIQQREALDEEEASLRDLIRQVNQTDDELEQECLQELEQIAQHRATLEERLVDSVLPQDEDDQATNVIIEVRAGTGGDEASLFAAELVDCYTKTAKSLKWKVESLSENRTDIGGVREASLSVTSTGGNGFRLPSSSDDSDDSAGVALGPFGTFKFESGVHRVQRYPVTDSSRIHTSACSVAILPSMPNDNNDDNELLPASELRIETMRSSGAGGQHVNTTDSAVRITHIPTKITASIQDERSQHKNKEKALRLIAARVRDRRRAEAERARGETRTGLMGGGDRSERIRTYNFPHDRVTDHRSKETRHGIDILLSGGANDSVVVSFLPLLKALHRQEKVDQLDEKSSNKV
jgi:peptide chain release factor 1